MKDNIKIFIIFCVFSLGLLIFGKTEKGMLFKLKVASVFAPLQKYETILYTLSKIRRENRFLNKRIAHLKLENQRLERFEDENERLKRLLELTHKKRYNLILAEVIGKSPNLGLTNVLIGRGKADGIEVDMSVVGQKGLYGKVVEVSKHTSRVQTLFDFNFRLSAMDRRSGVQGIARPGIRGGYFFDNVPLHSDIQIGDMVITSGLGGIFPKGLIIGKIGKIELDKTLLFYRAYLKLACNVSSIEYVFCVKEIEPIPFKEIKMGLPLCEILNWKIYYKGTIKKPFPPKAALPLPEFQAIEKKDSLLGQEAPELPEPKVSEPEIKLRF